MIDKDMYVLTTEGEKFVHQLKPGDELWVDFGHFLPGKAKVKNIRHLGLADVHQITVSDKKKVVLHGTCQLDVYGLPIHSMHLKEDNLVKRYDYNGFGYEKVKKAQALQRRRKLFLIETDMPNSGIIVNGLVVYQ